MNDFPILLRETEVDIYADDTTIWLSGANCNEIKQTLNVSLHKANSWLKRNENKVLNLLTFLTLWLFGAKSPEEVLSLLLSLT